MLNLLIGPECLNNLCIHPVDSHICVSGFCPPIKEEKFSVRRQTWIFFRGSGIYLIAHVDGRAPWAICRSKADVKVRTAVSTFSYAIKDNVAFIRRNVGVGIVSADAKLRAQWLRLFIFAVYQTWIAQRNILCAVKGIKINGPRQKNTWVVFGTGKAPSAWYKAISAAW